MRKMNFCNFVDIQLNGHCVFGYRIKIYNIHLKIEAVNGIIFSVKYVVVLFLDLVYVMPVIEIGRWRNCSALQQLQLE